MPAPSAPRAALLAAALLAAGAACTPKIGDPCRRAIDCSIRGERQCDLSNQYRNPDRRGECTVENCSFGTCPKEAVCVQSWGTQFLSVACDPAREDQPSVDEDGQSLPATDDCLAHEVCLPEGLCADLLSSTNSCRRSCKRDSDCRNGYECASVGSRGIYLSPDPSRPEDVLTGKICVAIE